MWDIDSLKKSSTKINSRSEVQKFYLLNFWNANHNGEVIESSNCVVTITFPNRSFWHVTYNRTATIFTRQDLLFFFTAALLLQCSVQSFDPFKKTFRVHLTPDHVTSSRFSLQIETPVTWPAVTESALSVSPNTFLVKQVTQLIATLSSSWRVKMFNILTANQSRKLFIFPDITYL